MYKNFFELEGYEVIGDAYDGFEAIDVYKKLPCRPDVVIMDHLMPNKNGIDAAKDILEFDSAAKILFVSIDKSIENTAIQIGARKFMSKPFHIQQLMDNIREVARY